jgi:hypothetical protein
MRVPATTGLPIMTLGSDTIHSSLSAIDASPVLATRERSVEYSTMAAREKQTLRPRVVKGGRLCLHMGVARVR